MKQIFVDIMTLLGTITWVPPGAAEGSAPVPMFPTIKVWNNQLQYMRTGQEYVVLFPAVFVELVSAIKYNDIGQSVKQADVVIRLHIVHEWYDAQDGTMEQDLVVFGMRDLVNETVSYSRPGNMTNLALVAETIDYDHDNLFHYVLDYLGGWVDATGSPTLGPQAHAPAPPNTAKPVITATIVGVNTLSPGKPGDTQIKKTI